MSGPFNEAPYPPLQAQDFGPGKQFRVEVHNGGRTIVIGDYQDLGFQKTPTYVLPTPGTIDVVIHGLPGRFIEKYPRTARPLPNSSRPNGAGPSAGQTACSASAEEPCGSISWCGILDRFSAE